MLKVGNNRVEVLDAMCGTGKTYNLFKWMHQNQQERFIYVTPSLSEAVNRPGIELEKIGDGNLCFYSPVEKRGMTKSAHLKQLLGEGLCVSCTHALFQNIDGDGIRLIEQYGYIAVIDEALEMIEPLSNAMLPWEDAKAFKEKGVIAIREDGRVDWIDEIWGEGKSKFADARRLASLGCLYANKEGTHFNAQLSVDLIRAAKRVVVCTYQFEGSVFHGYLRAKNIEWMPFEFDGLELRKQGELKEKLKARIEFCGSEAGTERLYRELEFSMNDMAARAVDTKLSHSWYAQSAKPNQLKALGNHIRNTARSHMKVPAEQLIYTLPCEPLGKLGAKWNTRRRKIMVKGYGPESCYLDKGARAMNDYAGRTAAIHAYNRYINPAVKTYLNDFGGRVDDDSFALAELIQWVFRTTIRKPDDSKLKLHIVSPRMDRLFKRWLNS